MNEENLSLFKLFLASDIGTVRLANLLECFGSAQNVLRASKTDLKTIIGIGDKIAQEIIDISTSFKAEKELEEAARNNITILLYNDAAYPAPLKDFDDKPVALYIKGSIKDIDFSSISVVGSRRVTNYGKSVTAEFSTYFAKRGVTIVSGLARGVDTQAHVSALESGGRTIAVLGNGLLVNYPPENRNLQNKIPENGAIISEFPLNRQPDRGTFPRRNRIIAAFSKATLVTEAAKGSGAVITAKFCADYGKDVFAVPGSIYSEYSRGSNELLKEGVFPATSPQEMAQQLDWLVPKNVYNQPDTILSTMEKSVLALIEKNDDGVHADTISQELNIDISDIAAILLKLEINKLIRNTPGQFYTKIR